MKPKQHLVFLILAASLLLFIFIYAASAQEAPQDAMIAQMDSRLRLHPIPSLGSETLVYLDPATPLRLIGRTQDREWLQVRSPDRSEGWAVAQYITVFINLDDVPITTDLKALDRGYALPEEVAEHIRAIFTVGQDLGNRPDVFSKVGDSISVSNNYLRPIGRGIYNLGDFQYLQGVIDYFSATPARDDLNSFEAYSVAAGVGWSTAVMLTTRYTDPSQCETGETPLTCEYRLLRPSVALIMLGTNDIRHFEPPVYEGNVRQIVEMTIERGIIPVLSTIPMQVGFEQKVNDFNAVITEVAASYNIPLWDYAGAMVGLPGNGLDTDGVHPSIPADGFEGSADFRAWNLYAGYVIRNLTALEMLHLVWKAVQ
jgi:hypothetical protein